MWLVVVVENGRWQVGTQLQVAHQVWRSNSTSSQQHSPSFLWLEYSPVFLLLVSRDK